MPSAEQRRRSEHPWERLVQKALGHANIQNTIIYAQLTNPARDQQARKLFASHRVVRAGYQGEPTLNTSTLDGKY